MSSRETRRAMQAALTLAGFLAAAAGSIGAQENVPAEVQQVDLRTSDSLGTVIIGWERAVEWSAEIKGRTLVVLLPHSVPGPEALDRSSRTGLISLVEVGFAVPNGVPTTRITIHSRKLFEHDGESTSAGLTIRVRAAGEVSESPAKPRISVADPPAGRSVSDSEALEKALNENDLLRQRMAALHSDRLQLREAIDSAQTQLAEQDAELDRSRVRASELEAANRRLVADNDAQKIRLAESQESATRDDARLRELSENLQAAEESNDSEQLTAENRRLSDELLAQRARLVESQRDSGRLQAAVGQLEGELLEARETAESKSADSRSAADELAATAARERELGERLRAARSDATTLRVWLSKAPEVLNARDFAVSATGSCLPLRPEPNAESAVLECLGESSTLAALSLRPDWLRVRTDGGREGWVSAERVVRALPEPDDGTQTALLEAQAEAEGARGRAAEAERELTAGRVALAEIRAELETERRRLRASHAELQLGQPTVSSKANPCLTVRAGPSADQRRLDCLPPGSTVSVEDTASGWLAVRSTAGVAGWVASRFIESSENAEATERIDSLEQELSAAQAQSQVLASRVETLRAELAELAEKAEVAERATQTASADRDRLQVFLKAANDGNRESANRLEEVSAKQQASERELTALRAELELERAESLAALKVGQVTVREDIDPCLSLRQEPDVDSRTLDCLPPGTTARALALAGRWFRLRLEDGREGWSSGDFLESAERVAFRGLESGIVERDEKISALQGEIDEARKVETERVRLSRELDTTRENVARLETLAERAGEVPLLESALEQARGALAAREERIQTLDGELEELESARSSLAAAEAERDRLAQRLTDLEINLAGSRDLLVESEASRASLAEQVEILELARAQLAGAAESRSELVERIGDLQAELASARLSISNSEARSRDLEAEALGVAKMRTSLAVARGYNDELAQRLATLEAEQGSAQDADEPVELAQIRQPLRSFGNNSADAAGPLAPLPAAPESPGMQESVAAEHNETAPAVEPVDRPDTVPVDLEALTRAWARAWSDQRVDDYLSFYAVSFVAPSGASREDWAISRRDRLSRPKFISVEVSNLRVQIHDLRRATVSFDQAYRSDTFQDRVVKTLELVREGSLWKIRQEEAG